MDQKEIKYFIEAALLAAGRPLSVEQIHSLFDGRSAPPKPDIRKAIAALDASLSPLDAVRAYLQAANEAVQPTTLAFARDFADLRGAKRLLDSHEDYLIAVTRSLLDRAVAEGQIEPVDTAAVAHVLGGLGREFARPGVAESIRSSPKKTADSLTGILLRGLSRG